MNSSKWSLVFMLVLSLVSTICPTTYLRKKRHAAEIQSNQSPKMPLYWEHIIREFVFRTISPSPPGNSHLYKKLLEAPFYGGSFPNILNVPNDIVSVVLSHGDVYCLPNGQWMFCQEGCVDCEACRGHVHPTVKWTLRRIKRSSSNGHPRQDLQLTVVPQIDGSHHINNLWPWSYVYVTTQGEQAAYLNDKLGREAAEADYASTEDSMSGQRPGFNNSGGLDKRGSLAERRVPEEQSNGTDPDDSRRDVGITETTTRDTITDIATLAQDIPRQPKRQHVQAFNETLNVISNEERKERIRQLIPKLILGTDQLGQKHLVHVVPADASITKNLSNLVLPGTLNSAGTGQYQNKSAYHRILRRIFDSLTSNRRSIEGFLEPLIHTARTSQPLEEYQQQETRHGTIGLGQNIRSYRVSNDGILNGPATRHRWPMTLNWNRQRRKSNGDVSAGGFISNSISVNSSADDSRDLYTEIRNVNINTTLSQDSGDRSGANRFNFKSIDRNYYNGNAFNGGTGTSNAIRNGREHGSGPRKFKIVVTTESTAKPLNNSAAITYHTQSTLGQNNLSVSANRSIVLNNENGPLHYSLRNATQ